jgi:hypothetical protein
VKRASDAQIEQYRRWIAEGKLRAGMTRAEVKAALGQPDAWGLTSRQYRTPSLFL